MPRQFLLSCARSESLFNVCDSFDRSSLIPMLAKSYLPVCIQVVFGLPCSRFTFLRYSLRAFLAGVSGCKRMRCPSHVSLLSLIILLHGSHFVLAKSSSLVIFLCQLIPKIFLRHKSNNNNNIFSISPQY